jgi:hypothetical protein
MPADTALYAGRNLPFYSDCTNQWIQISQIRKISTQICPNADGSVTYRFHDEGQGTGESYDPITGQLTGTKYIINAHIRDHLIIGAPTDVGCQTLSDVFTFPQELISQGAAPNEKIRVHETVRVDSSCNITSTSTFES